MPWKQIDGKNVWFNESRSTPKQRESHVVKPSQEEKECSLCQKPFTQAVPKQKFCSKSCSRKASKFKRMNEMTEAERKAFKYGLVTKITDQSPYKETCRG